MVIPFSDGDVPGHFKLEVGIIFDLVPSLAEKDPDIQFIVRMQHSEQRRVVLDGVRTEDGKPMSHDVAEMICSTAERNFCAFRFVVYSSSGSKLAFHGC